LEHFERVVAVGEIQKGYSGIASIKIQGGDSSSSRKGKALQTLPLRTRSIKGSALAYQYL